MKTTIQVVLTVFALTASLSVHAGKAERDFVESRVLPAVKAAEAQYKKSCTGDLKIDVKFETFPTIDELRQVMHFANAVTDGSPKYCNDKTTQSIMSRMKVLEISNTGKVTFNFSGNKGVATTDASSYPSWDMVVSAVDR